MTDTHCPFFGRCGGCIYTQSPDYLPMKKHWVEEALSHKALSAPIEDVQPTPLHVRRRVTFAFHKNMFGFHALKTHTIVPITDCPVLLPQLAALIEPLRALTTSFNTRGSVFVLWTEQGADIAIDADITPNLSQIESITAFCQTHQIARLTFNDMPMYQTVTLPFAPKCFMQPSQEGERLLVQQVTLWAQGARRAADLFCGLGTFTHPLQNLGISVEAFDSNAQAIATLSAQATAQTRDLFRDPISTDELNKYDLVVLDPARAGAMAQCQNLAPSSVAKVIMISCHLGSFARDARILVNGGYKLEKIVPVDQFIYSRHLEVVALFTKTS